MSENVVGGLRVPPQSIEAEEAVLGGILLDNQALERAGDILAEEDFYRESHRRIWRSLVELDQRREPADVITVTECLKRRGDLDAVGGAAAIAELVERTATAANVMLYARIVKEKAILRGLVDVASDVVGRAMSGNTGDVEQFLDEAENAVYRISERRVRAGFSKVEEIIVGSIERIQQLYERRELVTGVPTLSRLHPPDSDHSGCGCAPRRAKMVSAAVGMYGARKCAATYSASRVERTMMALRRESSLMAHGAASVKYLLMSFTALMACSHAVCSA